MSRQIRFFATIAVVFTLPVATLMLAKQAEIAARPEGPCDIYAAANCPCVAAHSSTRALYSAYNGPLYQVMRQSDGKTFDVGVVAASAADGGGYADATAQDNFCANTYCWITKLYDQSGKGNHLVQAPRGGFSGPAMGGFNNLPVADMAPVTIMGHKAYGIFIEPGMGLRWNNAKGTAVDDQAEGQYWVVNGHHFNSGCCFDYGNAETDSRDDGNGTMETTYFGNANSWYHGNPPGPWIMTDQENNLVGCVNPDGSKLCPTLPNISWRFVTAIAKGEPHHWTSMGGDSQQGELKVMFDGKRVNNSYDPMRKQGAILLGNGGDNSVGSQGTFYEGAMTAAGTFPSDATDQKVQANVVAAKYTVQRLSVAPSSATAAPPGLQTFALGSSQETAVTFTNTTGAPVKDVKLSLTMPAGWSAVISGGTETSKTFSGPVASGETISANFKVTSSSTAFNGDLVGNVSWTGANGQSQTEKMAEKVRNVSPIKINEFAIASGAPANTTNSFIELYNAGDGEVDLSNWTLTQHPTQQASFSDVKIPSGTKLAAKGFYLLGLSNSGLVAAAKKGDSTIHVRSTADMNAGDRIEIDTGAGVESRKIANVGSAAGNITTLWQPLPDGPVLTIPAGSTNVPVTSTAGFEVGQKIGLGYGTSDAAVARTTEQYEVVTVKEIGKPGTQTYLAATAQVGDTSIRVRNAANISVGDKIVLDIDSVDHGIETVTVKTAATQGEGAASRGGRGGSPGTIELTEPLKFKHENNMPLSVRGTGITFEPATTFVHVSNEPVQPLGTGITLDSALSSDHAIDAAVRDAAVKTAGYQGDPSPNQWFGGPALSPSAGVMVLRDSKGNVADSLNYGGMVDPWAAEGYQAGSGAGQSGCKAPSPAEARGGPGRGGPGAGAATNRSTGRYPDGADTDSNCRDFHVQVAANLPVPSIAGATNIKVSSVAEFAAGQSIIIDSGANREIAVIASVGTPGGTTVGSATEEGATTIQVVSAAGFNPGQTITIDSDANRETAVVASVAGGGNRGGRGGQGPTSITLTAPLKMKHAADAEVSGSGITLSAGLAKSHERGVPIAGSVPTPGASNQYSRRPQ